MKRFLKSTSLLALVAMPVCANAQSPTDAANFTTNLKVFSKYSLMDSTRKNNMDSVDGTARFGLKYRYKNASAVLSVQGATSGAFVVRNAHLGLDLVAMDPATITFVMGRYRFVASNVYGPADGIAAEVATHLDNASSSAASDGLVLKYAGKFEFGKLGLQAGYVNNIVVMQSKVSGGALEYGRALDSSVYNFASATASQSRGMQLVASGDINAGDGVVEARLGYGAQAKAFTKVSTNEDGDITSATARDISSLEASVGYDYKGQIKGGVWFQTVTLGKKQELQTASKKSNNYDFKDVTDSKEETITTIGVGASGDSKLFGLSGMLADGDALTYGVAFQNSDGTLASGGGSYGVASFTDVKLQVNSFNVGIGYMQGPLALELNYLMSSANYAVYKNNDGELKEKTSSSVYLTGTLSL